MSEADKAPSDRRQFNRFEVKLSVLFRDPQHAENEEAVGITGNLSRGGLLLFREGKAAKGEIIELEVRLPDDPAPMRVRGEVAWVSPPSEDGAKATLGIRFVGMGPVDRFRILEYVYQNWLEDRVEKHSSSALEL